MFIAKNAMFRTVLAMAGFVAAIVPGRAQSLPMPLFSAANITLGETLRVNIVNLGDPTLPPGPCDLEVTFFNALGQTVKTSDVGVNVGQIGGATVNFLEASQADVTGAAGSSLRQVLRPVISVIPPGPCRVVMSLEVYESTSGRTQQYIPPIYIPAAQATTTPSTN